MKHGRVSCLLLVGVLFFSPQKTASAQSECDVVSLSRRGAGQVYRTCDDCLRDSRRCEKRCYDTNYVCTAEGYDRYGTRRTVQGVPAGKERRARRRAVRQCRKQGLNGCDVEHCTEEKTVRPETVEVCRDRQRDWGRDRSRNEEYRCGIFPASRRAPNREYPNCKACLKEHGLCEERCAQSGYVCTAAGYNRYGFRETVQGELSGSRRRAEKKAIRQCRDAGMDRCTVEQCSEEMQFDPDRVTPCRTERPDKRPSWKKDRPERRPNMNLPVVPPAPRPARKPAAVQPQRQQRPERRPNLTAAPPAPWPARRSGKKYVVSWQHLKGPCQGQPYHKIAEQCGNRVNFWHGIYCRVTWSDGKVTDLHGKTNQVDAYGRAYCTRDTRPAQFNCVSQCDNTNGALMTLPKP